jgi:NitT/TauT family transport system ATP-binding protein
MSALALHGVGHAYFGRTVLDGVSLEIARGDCVALVGPSGSGKSTLLQIAAGLVEPSRGRVARNYGRHAMVFQDPRLLAWRDAAGNIAYALARRGVSGRALKVRIAEMAQLVDLTPEDLEKFPIELSGGMKQRVAIARALAVAPDFVYFDEPFSALDVGLRQRMQDLALGALLKSGASALFVTHDLAEAARIAHRVLVLAYDGAGIAGERRIDGAPLARDARHAFETAHRFLTEDALFAHLNDVEERRAL